jgi:hypothetical protein
LGLVLQRPDDGQTVQQVMREHFRFVAHRREVVNLVPLLDESKVAKQARLLRRSQCEAKFIKALLELGVRYFATPDCSRYRLSSLSRGWLQAARTLAE